MKADILTTKEQLRLNVQVALDAERTQIERNRKGQFATPAPLALEIMSYADKLIPRDQKIRFLDPGLGTGAFYSALLRYFPSSRIATATGYEIDPYYGNAAIRFWSDTGLDVRLSDFTKATPPEDKLKFNLLICNPPYVRHHHILNGDKMRIQAASHKSSGIQFSGLAGLYCHFLGLAHAWMSEGGIAGWLIPSEFMDVNYGEAVKRYLLEKVTLLHIQRFDPIDLQFDDALVSSTVIWFRKKAPPKDHVVKFTFGGTLTAPKISRIFPVDLLRTEPKWTRFPLAEIRPTKRSAILADFFSIRRGLATGNNNYFILTPAKIAEHRLPLQFFKPILPSPRHLPVTEILPDESGNPIIENPLFILDCRLSEAEVIKSYPTLWRYFQEGRAQGVAERYLCQNRSPWYLQENRPAAPFFCTYLGRSNVKSGRPFRFILNLTNATVTNVYLALYPKEALIKLIAGNLYFARQVWEILNRICPKSMLAEGRVYGGGLHKIEPKELANVPVNELADFLYETRIKNKTYHSI